MKQVSFVHKIVISMGFSSVAEFVLKYLLPVLSAVVVVFGILLFTLSAISPLISYGVLFIGVIFTFTYPYVIFEKKKMNINENMHLFITFAGSIATLDVQRNILFKKIAEKESFGELSSLTKKIVYLAKGWNLGFAEACRQVGRVNPSRIFADFLDRFAIMLDFGNSLQRFLGDEQIAVLDDYAVEYKKSLEKIKTIQEIFMALTISLAFLMSIGLLLPLVAQTGDDGSLTVIFAVVLAIDIILVLFVRQFIPNDELMHSLAHKSEGMAFVERVVFWCVPASVLILVILVYWNITSFIMAFSIASIPLFIAGLYAQNEEEEVYRRDKAYPSFIRSLGAAIDIRQGGVVSALYSLQVHDFGPLNTMAFRLYRRLRTGNLKQRCWQLFGAESGSNLISQFTNIFAESIFLGGLAEKIGEIVSSNFTRLLSLRKLRIQLTSSLRGAMYGAMVGFAVSAYTAAYITQVLAGILGSGPTGNVSELGDIVPSFSFEFDLDQAVFIISLMIIVHSVVSGLVIKIAEGGYWFAAFFDVTVMLWMGAIFHHSIPFLIGMLLPGLEQMFATAG